MAQHVKHEMVSILAMMGLPLCNWPSSGPSSSLPLAQALTCWQAISRPRPHARRQTPPSAGIVEVASCVGSVYEAAESGNDVPLHRQRVAAIMHDASIEPL